jgi:hypothetical protein
MLSVAPNQDLPTRNKAADLLDVQRLDDTPHEPNASMEVGIVPHVAQRDDIITGDPNRGKPISAQTV